jgi:branched-chain amino acid transport system ATP-binding protein
MLEIKDIRVHYGKVEAIKGVSLTVAEGDVVTLLGANGAGKTTILRTISGLIRPTSGEIWFKGERIDRSKASAIVKMGIGHVPEARRVFPYLSVEDNLMMGAYVRKDKEATRQDLEELYGHFPILKSRRKQKAGSLSGGEQQMLAISRALMCKPVLVLMDEPTVGVSPVMEEEIAKVIRMINAKGIAVLLVEQDAAMALRLANRGYVIEIGRIVLSGEREELANNDDVRRAYLGG